MKKIKIRSARIEDLEEIKRLEDSSFQYPYTREFLLYLLRHCELFLVAELDLEENNELVGYVCGKIERGFRGIAGHVISIAVDPNHRRKGIGRILMSKVMEGFRKLGATFVYLECRVSNVSAQKFYESIGFRMAGIIKKYYQNGEDAIIYKKDLLCE